MHCKFNLVNILVVSLSLTFMSCEPKEFYPDINSIRDPNLIGTWRYLTDFNPEDSSGLFVFTIEGYADGTYWVNNQQMKGFFDLGGLWYNIQLPDDNEIGEVYHASRYDSWQMRRWESNFYYKLSSNKDTLLKGRKYNLFTDTLVWNEYQLVFEGADYIRIDTLIND